MSKSTNTADKTSQENTTLPSNLPPITRPATLAFNPPMIAEELNVYICQSVEEHCKFVKPSILASSLKQWADFTKNTLTAGLSVKIEKDGDIISFYEYSIELPILSHPTSIDDHASSSPLMGEATEQNDI